jgi:NuA3 HAT complex component NTO1
MPKMHSLAREPSSMFYQIASSSPADQQSCIFCPNEGGAFKKTTTGHWAHLLCAIWIPELTVGNAIYMEPVQDVELLPKSRWKLVRTYILSRVIADIQMCSLCHERVGACIQCENKQCFTAFHVTCARQAAQLMTMKTLGTEGVLKAYCDKHLPVSCPDYICPKSRLIYIGRHETCSGL